MENVNKQEITIKAQKSSAPMICGCIGFVLGIPAILCGTVCSSLCAGLTAAGAQASGGSGAEGGVAMLPIIIMAICWILGFVLCFFAMGPKSKKTGIWSLVSGIVMMLSGLFLLNVLGIVSGVLYTISGGLAISNAKKA